MKKIFSYAMLLLAGTFAMTSCEKDLDSNPTLEQPTELVLNNPAVGAGLVDLAKSEGFDLTWSQPKYTTMNAPVVATYYVQLSSTGQFTKEYDETADDNTGANFITLDAASTECKTTVSAATVAKSLQMLNNYADGVDLAKEELSIRLKGTVLDAGLNEHGTIYSNVVKVTAQPYYVELKDAPVVMWYLVGNMFGGRWGSAIGDTALPMFMVDGYEYDKKTGCGELEFTNYFETGAFDNTAGNESSTSGFKIQRDDFNWDWGMTGDNGQYGVIIYRNGGGDGGHIVAPEDGVYTIKMNTEKHTATMEKYEGTVWDYGHIQISGSFNGWSDTDMNPYNRVDAENHAWFYVMDTAEPVEFKFKLEGSWDTNWGSNTFPTGIGTNNGPNISLEAGKWCISFNDITGAYSIVAL